MLSKLLVNESEYSQATTFILSDSSSILTQIYDKLAQIQQVGELKITEFNSGIYCFNKDKLIESIQKLQTNNAQNEYYLTDIINILYEEKHIISGHCISTVYEVLGANTQEELQTLNEQAIKLAH